MVAVSQLPESVIMVNVQPTLQLLLHCARTHINEQTADQIRTLVTEEIDWQYLLQVATHHEVMPLLYKNLHAICPKNVPESILVQLRSFFYSNAAFNLSRTQELLNLLNLLKQQDIPAIPFKGAILATKAYGNVTLRQFCDLDILIHKQDISKVQKLLLMEGYQLVSKSIRNKTHELLYLQSACEYNYFNEDRNMAVEPHWEVSQKKFGIFLNIQDLWERSEEILLDTHKVSTFSAEDSLLVICINGTKDRWKSLKHICDVAELINSYPEMDWLRLIRQTEAIGCKRILLLGLLLARDILGVDLPDEVQHQIKTDLTLKALSLQVFQNLLDKSSQPSKRFGANFSLWDIQVRECLWDKFFYLCNLIFGPNEGDAEFFLLPVFLHWLYPFLRPFRLMARFGLSLVP